MLGKRYLHPQSRLWSCSPYSGTPHTITGQCKISASHSFFYAVSLCVWLVGELKRRLEEAIMLYNQSYPVLLKLIRHTKRRGLAQARNTGLEAATADVVAILDAHIEVNVGW